MSISVLLYAILFTTLVTFLYYLFNVKLKDKTKNKNIKILGSRIKTKTLVDNFVFVCIVEVLFILFLYYIIQ